jgi:hypothetical protein
VSFTISFDYRFDTSGFFDLAERRDALEQAAAEWEAVIGDDFEDVPIGTSFDINNPSTGATERVTLTRAVDDLIVFVGARSFPGATLAIAGPDGADAAGDAFSARISSNFRDMGAVTDFEPWAGVISFNSESSWSFDPGGPSGGQNDFVSVAVHEIGHILGVGTSGAFDRWMVDESFTGPNAMALNGGTPLPMEADHAHVEEGFADDTVALDPYLLTGSRVLVSAFDKAILADIGYEIAGFDTQGETPTIATAFAERIFGRNVADDIDGLGGSDSLQGADGNDVLSGNAGNDELFGQAGDDTLLGGAGDDYVDGGSGRDELGGGSGHDTVFGGGGTDIFVVQPGDGRMTISDFDLAGETVRFLNSGFASAEAVLDTITKPYSNISRVTLPDGTTLDIFHASQGGSPFSARHFELVSTDEATTGVDGSDAPGDDVLRDDNGNLPEPDARVNGVLEGTDGDDGTLVATAGIDRINGYEGVDTAIFAGDQAGFTLSLHPDGLSLTDRGRGGDPITLDNVELIDFGTEIPAFDAAMDLRQFGGHTGLDHEAFESFVEMYIAYFNRAPDAIGLAFWGTAYANGMSLEDIAAEFAVQPETLALYPTEGNNFRFVADVYQNVLGRAPDIDGLRFWTDALQDGTGRDDFILAMLHGVQSGSTDRAYLDQKTDLGALFAVHRGMSDIDHAAQVMAHFDGSDDSVQRTVDAIDAFYSAATDAETGEFLMPLVGVMDNPFAT